MASTRAFTGSLGASAASAESEESAVLKSGRLPTSTSKSSPSTTFAPFLSICWEPKCGSRSVTQNTGSAGSSPMFTSITSPSVVATTPCSAKGSAVHW